VPLQQGSPPTYLSVQVIAQMDWCVITMACVLLERPSAVAALQLVRAYQSIPTLFASGCTKLQGSHACYNIRATLPFGAVLVDLKRKGSVLLADDCILQADCNGNVCAVVANNASCGTTGEEMICLIVCCTGELHSGLRCMS